MGITNIGNIIPNLNSRHGTVTWYRQIIISATSWFRPELAILTFFWMWIVTLTFFIKGIDTKAADVNIFKIVYVALALLFINAFQVSQCFFFP